ncbi:hypothetical protein [Demequina sp. NBRC 110054]|uniref:hypothetical protein n=1 Tax=Demequina sp. NBRC 110054 TaxID=1570343 RepID=UPI0011783EB8|nr:hypothetical protein [Demequina sp. NBRC 110054]
MAVKVSRNVWVGGGVAGLAVLAVGVGWALAGPGGDADASPEVKVTVTAAAPAASSSPEPSASATVDPYADDLDGILDDEYPAEAAARTDPNADIEGATTIAYPDALVMEDWVWDRVGDGWGVVAASADTDWADGWVQPAAVVYLVSPEGVYFEVGELPEAKWAYARVVSWVEDEEYVRVRSSGGSFRYDLRTGATEDLQFAVYGANSDWTGFVAADAEGNELWRATSENGTKHYRWDAATGEWAASILVDAYPDFASDWYFFSTWCAVSGDGELVALRDPSSSETVVVYDLGQDTAEAVDVAVGRESDMTAFFRDRTLVVQFRDQDLNTVAVMTYDVDSGVLTELDEVPDLTDEDGQFAVGWHTATDNSVTYFEER